MRHADLLGGHQGGELRVLAHEHVRPPLPHRGSHGREHRSNVQRREYVAEYHPLSVLGGQRRNMRPQWSELVFRRRGTDRERVAGAPHHAGEPWRPATSTSWPARRTASMKGTSGWKWPAPRVEAKRTRTSRR